eukprot:TRINITY_DN6606_c0_g1_i5.p1 TRINITY_DN6606_c0_g1~~TRINITY_DN6606_c0_g1_i5.p1  ORF type:complete len:171 (-),score=15.07 TRINITY_DN6606_c0_g1_i5:132-644(-)
MWKSAVLVFLIPLLEPGLGKVCWEECPDWNVIQHMDINGCHRRSTYPHLQDFRCDGMKGPPCTVLRGQEVTLDVTWKDLGHKNLTQNVVWQSFVDIPWVGMETEICKYVNDGASCPGQGVQEGNSRMKFPIKVLEMYPSGFYNLKWELLDRLQDGTTETKLCFLFAIRIM